MSGTIIVLIIIFLIVISFVGFMAGKGLEPETHQKSGGSLDHITDPSSLIERAQDHEERNNWGRAMRIWSRYMEVEPTDEEAYLRRGLAAYRDNDYEQAVTDLRETVKRLVDCPDTVYLFLARSLNELDRPESALDSYDAYLDVNPGDLNAANEAAQIARSLGNLKLATEYYKHVREVGDGSDYIDATLNMVDLQLKQSKKEKALSLLSDLKELRETDALSPKQELEYLYNRATIYEKEGNLPKAAMLYRQIHRNDPKFRDVKSILKTRLADIDDEQLLQRYLEANKDEFRGYCKQVVQSYGYVAVEISIQGEDELDIIAREEKMSFRVNTVLFMFKQWDNSLGELPIKEFEFRLVEDRHDRGYFVSPGGFKNSAENYARQNEKIELVGEEELLEHLREF